MATATAQFVVSLKAGKAVIRLGFSEPVDFIAVWDQALTQSHSLDSGIVLTQTTTLTEAQLVPAYLTGRAVIRKLYYSDYKPVNLINHTNLNQGHNLQGLLPLVQTTTLTDAQFISCFNYHSAVVRKSYFEPVALNVSLWANNLQQLHTLIQPKIKPVGIYGNATIAKAYYERKAQFRHCITVLAGVIVDTLWHNQYLTQPILTQCNTLAVNNLIHTQTIPVVEGMLLTFDLVPNSSLQGHTITEPVIVYRHLLITNNLNHQQSIIPVTIEPAEYHGIALLPDNLNQENNLPAIGYMTLLAVIAPDSLLHTQTVGEIIIVSRQLLEVHNIDQQHTTAELTLTQLGYSIAHSLYHAQTITDAVVLQQHCLLRVDSAIQATVLQNAVEVIPDITLVIDPLQADQSLSVLSVNVKCLLSVYSLSQTHTLSVSSLSRTHTLSQIHSLSQIHTLSVSTLSVTKLLSVNTLMHNQSLDTANTFYDSVINPEDVTHVHWLVEARPQARIRPYNCIQQQHLNRVAVIQASSLTVSSASHLQTLAEGIVQHAFTLEPRDMIQGSFLNDVYCVTDLITLYDLLTVEHAQLVSEVILKQSNSLKVNNMTHKQLTSTNADIPNMPYNYVEFVNDVFMNN